MYESKYSKFLTVILILGIIIIVAILGTTGFIVLRNGESKKEAENAVDRFEQQLNEINDNINNNEIVNNEIINSNEITNILTNEVIVNEIAPIIGVENVIINNNNSNNNNSNNGTTSSGKTQTYKGFTMVGTIQIPAIDLKYPVLKDASKNAIEVAVGIFDGPGLNEIGNTTIAGHNYRDGRFFSNNKKLKEGDKIYITDTKGRKVTYVIYKTYTTSPEDSSYLERDTQGKREISLTTCTDDAQSRLIIWAKEQ